jgi:hypothetical protein
MLLRFLCSMADAWTEWSDQSDAVVPLLGRSKRGNGSSVKRLVHGWVCPDKEKSPAAKAQASRIGRRLEYLRKNIFNSGIEEDVFQL